MTQAPSLKETLEIVENLIRRDPACFNLSDELQSVRAALRAALAPLQPSGEKGDSRDKFEKAWANRPWNVGDETGKDRAFRWWSAALASVLVQDEAAIRADEREKCAKALDDIETDADGKCRWTDVALATAAIRSASDGGEG